MSRIGLRATAHYLPERWMTAAEVGAASGIPEHVLVEKFGLRGKHIAAEDEHEPVLPDRLHEQLRPFQLDLFELLAHGDAPFGGRAAGAAVADCAVGIECAEVTADGDVAGADREVDPQGLQDAAADAELERVVAE